MILAVRTDTYHCQLHLYKQDQLVESMEWNAGRELSHQLLRKIDEFLKENDSTVNQLKGLIVYKGPGSFTGLRIGISVMNAMAYALDIPIVGVKSDNWAKQGLEELADSKNDTIVIPEYGAKPNITKPKK